MTISILILLARILENFMNYFNSLTKWIEQPLAEYNTELATLNIDEVVDTHTGQTILSKAILNDYTSHWLSLVFDQIQKKNSLTIQTEPAASVKKESFEFLKKRRSNAKRRDDITPFPGRPRRRQVLAASAGRTTEFPLALVAMV